MTHPHDGYLDVGPLSPTRIVATAGGFIALVGVTASFTGIELPTVMAEEAKDLRRTVARATRLAVIVTGGLYAVSAWALMIATGPRNIQAAARTHGPQLIFDLVTPYLLAPLVQLGQLLFLTSLFAAALAFHATAARYLFALGREGVLPGWLGKTSRHTGAPARASLTHSLIAATALAGYVAAGWRDPLTHLLFWGTVAGGFGVLILRLPARWRGSATAPTHPHPPPLLSLSDQEGRIPVRNHPATAVQPGLGIRQATPADLDQITATLVDAFLDTPDARWLIPDRDARHTVYPRLCAALAGYTLRKGRIDIAGDGRA